MSCKEEEECVIFSSTMEPWGCDQGSAVHINREEGITREQYDWIIKHKDEFDKFQYNNWISLFFEDGNGWCKIR